jgi:hypothetical protein
VLDKFDAHFQPQKNTIHHRAIFHRRNQLPGETVEQYVRELYSFAEKCDFTDKKEDIRDMFVIGVRDMEISKSLQLIDDLTLDEAVKQARQVELVKTNLASKDKNPEISNVRSKTNINRKNFSRHPRHTGYAQQSVRQGNKSQSAGAQGYTFPCKRCAHDSHRNGNCPAKKLKCYSCGKFGHFGKLCRGRQRQVNDITAENGEMYDNMDELSTSFNSNMFLGNIACPSVSKPWFVKLKVCGTDIKFKVDSGADATIISKTSLREFAKQTQFDKVRHVIHSCCE